MSVRFLVFCLLIAGAPLAADDLRLDDFRGVQRGGYAGDEFQRYSLGFFVEPNTRIAFEPLALMYTAGFEFGVRGTEWVGFYAAAGLHVGRYDDGKDRDREFRTTRYPSHMGMSLAAGVRFQGPHAYRASGYLDIGMVFAGFHGEEDTRETYSMGWETFGGIEFGGSYVRGFIGTGVTLLAPLNRADAGWLKTEERHGGLGVHFTLIRGGVRFRF